MILHELVHAFPIFVKNHELYRVVSRNPRYTSFPFDSVRVHITLFKKCHTKNKFAQLTKMVKMLL